jgi:hypothetical protein
MDELVDGNFFSFCCKHNMKKAGKAHLCGTLQKRSSSEYIHYCSMHFTKLLKYLYMKLVGDLFCSNFNSMFL